MLDVIKQPWPWYISGPLIGLMVPLLLFIGNKAFGISSSLRHFCAACGLPGKFSYFQYNWKAETWNLFFVAGILLGGLLTHVFLMEDMMVDISQNTRDQLASLGVINFDQYLPTSIFSWSNVFTFQGFFMMILGGFLVGFGARYAGGCTSGHAITGMANLQLSSLIAVIGFFIGGLFMTHVVLPYIL